jgi:cytochrome c oxidase subunit 1
MKEQPEVHLPAPSFWPIVLAFSLALIAAGVVSSLIVSVVGLLLLLGAIAGWTMENRAVDQESHDE